MTHINNSYASSINRFSRSYRIFSQHIKNVHNIILTINNTFLPTVITKNQKQRLTIPTPQGPNFYPACISTYISHHSYTEKPEHSPVSNRYRGARAQPLFFSIIPGDRRARARYISRSLRSLIYDRARCYGNYPFHAHA